MNSSEKSSKKSEFSPRFPQKNMEANQMKVRIIDEIDSYRTDDALKSYRDRLVQIDPSIQS